ncbi:putative glycolipid-binding domain-containing protein [Streptomyces sp. NPDC048057]|uniref:putative glycolipid-binding domain-containing protein n=1 Tax=Streptomyces sp. NPDC048057 TaxID=3155628 RepID=UPI0033F94547
MTTSHVLTWEVVDNQGYETAWVTVADGALTARGRAVGISPEPYWISYELRTGTAFVTRELTVTAESADGVRTVVLRRDDDGRWSVDGEPRPDLDGALDCDLGLCPLTNTMPVLRHGLHLVDGPGGAERSGVEREFLMAWVSVPDLTVSPSAQTYTRLEPTEDGGALLRYASGDFRRDIEVDGDGFVVDYPDLAYLIGHSERGDAQ